MPRMNFRTWVDASLDDVWAFHQDIESALPELSPPQAGVEVVRADPPGPGANVELSAKTPLGRKTWLAVYREFQPPTGSRPHREAWFADEMVKGPFKTWRHRHRFEESVRHGRAGTLCIDDLAYTVPLGPIGAAVGSVLVKPKIKSMFEYRQKRLVEIFGAQVR